jgi:hypothetical protein
MPGKITGMHPHSGGIPRPDNSYELVLANSVPPLNRTFCPYFTPDNSDFDKELAIQAGMILSEVSRVLVPNGRFVVWPSVSKIDPANARFSYRLDPRHEKIREYEFNEGIEPSIVSRSVLTKI